MALLALKSVFTTLSAGEKEAKKLEEKIATQVERLLQAKPGQGFVAFSCRVMFDIFLSARMKQEPEKKKVLMTSFMHTSFPRSIEALGLGMDIIDIVSEDCIEFDFNPSRYNPKDYLAVIITHAFGYPFKIDKIMEWATKNNLIVLEDAVQAQLFPVYKGHPLATVVVFSGGLDKVPASFGGGYSIVRDPKLLLELRKECDQLPRQTNIQRLPKLLEGLMLWMMYRHQFVAMCIRACAVLFGYRLHELALVIRKSASGFVHDRAKFCLRPSVANLCCMTTALTIDWKPTHEEMVKKRVRLRKLMGEEASKWFMPWDRSEGESAPYCHVAVDDTDAFLKYVSDVGFVCLHQQSWFDTKAYAPVTGRFVDRLCIITMVFPQTDEQLQFFAQTLKNYADSKKLGRSF